MERSIIINQDLTFKEIFSSTLYFFFTSKRVRLFVLILIGLTLISSFLGLLTTSEFNTMDIVRGLAVFPVCFLLGILLLAIMCLLMYKMRPSLFKIKYEFNNWGMHWDNGNGQSSKAWREISAFKETKSFFLLYTDKSNLHTIQKRLLKEFDGINTFKSLLEEKIKP